MSVLPFVVLLFLLTVPALAQEVATATPAQQTQTSSSSSQWRHRRYRALLSPVREVEMVALNGLTLNKGLQDLYVQGIGPELGAASSVVGTLWSATFTYLTTLWPHELGHWSRAPQVGGRFVFHDYMPFFPTTTVELSDAASDEQRALISVGGFEVNALMARRFELEFHQRGWAYSDELVHGLLQEMFFPIYAFLVIPRDPTLASTWTRTAGDPVHFVLPTWQQATGRQPLRGDGSVDPGLVRYYREATLTALVLPWLDPTTWQALLAFFDAHERGHYATRRSWVLLGDRQFGWTYGTRFVPTVLGYELHLDNYLFLGQRLVVLSPHAGRLSKNVGVALRLPELLRTSAQRVGVDLDVWSQERYGFGAALTAEVEHDFSNGVSLFARVGAKDEGYLVGRRLATGVMALAGIGGRLATHQQ